MKILIPIIFLIFSCSCSKTWTCEVSNKNVPNEEPIIVHFKGTKEEMKTYEQNGTYQYGTFDIETKCK